MFTFAVDFVEDLVGGFGPDELAMFTEQLLTLTYEIPALMSAPTQD